MLKRAEPPICVGLYARWGSGKTFMISLLKKEFDPTVRKDPRTQRLVQFFEAGYKDEPADDLKETICSLFYGMLTAIVLAFVPAVPYWLTTCFSIICDAFNVRDMLAWLSRLKRSCTCCKSKVDVQDGYTRVPDREEQKEFIFVDFNAWECAAWRPYTFP